MGGGGGGVALKFAKTSFKFYCLKCRTKYLTEMLSKYVIYFLFFSATRDIALLVLSVGASPCLQKQNWSKCKIHNDTGMELFQFCK